MAIDLVVFGNVKHFPDVVPHDQFVVHWNEEWIENGNVVAVHVQQWEHSIDWYTMEVVAVDVVLLTAQLVVVQVLVALYVVDRQHETECWSLWAAALWSAISAVYAVGAVQQIAVWFAAVWIFVVVVAARYFRYDDWFYSRPISFVSVEGSRLFPLNFLFRKSNGFRLLL